MISALSVNEERARQVGFSAAYADAPNAVVVASTSQATSAETPAALIEAIGSGAIGVQAGTTHEQVVRVHFPQAEIRVYERPDQIADDIVAGRIEAGLMERSSWEPIIAARGDKALTYAGPLLTSADFPEFGSGQAVALKLGNDALKAGVDKAIQSMLADGTVRALSQKWFGYDVSAR